MDYIDQAKTNGLPVIKDALAEPLYIFIPFSREGLAKKQRAIADNINIDMELLPDNRLHMTLLWAEHCTEAALAAIISGLAMPIRFGIEIASLTVLKDALAWVAVADPALMRLQSDLYRRALNQGVELSEYSLPNVWVPHISIAYDCIGLPEVLPQIEPFKLEVDRFVVGRYDYEKVYTVHLARAMGDRVLVEQGEVLRRDIIARHGEHEGQEGREGQAGGSKPGFTHGGTGGEKREKLSKNQARQLRRSASHGWNEKVQDYFFTSIPDAIREESEGKDFMYFSEFRPLGSWANLPEDVVWHDRMVWSDKPLALETIYDLELGAVNDKAQGHLWKSLYEDENDPPSGGEHKAWVFVRQTEEGDNYKGFVVHPATASVKAGSWRASYFDLKGFAGHSYYQTPEDAISEQAGNYSWTLRPDLFESISEQESFIVGNNRTMLRHQREREEVPFNEIMDEVQEKYPWPEGTPGVSRSVDKKEIATDEDLEELTENLLGFLIKKHISLSTEVTRSELMALMRGETIVHGVLRQVLTIKDGPFTIRRHSRKRCMNCKKPSQVAAHWADNRGKAWFCLKDFETWVKEEDRELTGVWFIKDGEIPDNLRDIGSKDKVRKLGEKLSTKEILKRLKSLRERGGHPGEVGNAQPIVAPSLDTGMKKAQPSLKGKKKMFGKEYYVPFANLDDAPKGSDFVELWESAHNDEWPAQANKLIKGLLEDSVQVEANVEDEDARAKALETMKEWAVEERLEEFWNIAGSYLGLPIPPEQLAGMNNAEIEYEMRKMATENVVSFSEDDITEFIEDGNLEADRYVTLGNNIFYGGYNRLFGRNENGEIVSAMMMQNDVGFGNQIAEWIGGGFEGPEDARRAAVEESYDSPYLAIQWLASRYHGNGYGTQMMAEAFKYAAGNDAGLFLNAAEVSVDFYHSLEPTVEDGTVFVWTPSKVVGLAKRSTEEGFTGKSLTTREALSDVKIGGEEIVEREDLESLDGAFVSPLDARKTFPRPWRKKIEKEQGLGFISDEDMEVLGERDVLSKLPEGSFGMFSTARGELMKGVRKSLEGLVLNVMGWVRHPGEQGLATKLTTPHYEGAVKEEQKIDGEEQQETPEEQEQEKSQEPEKKEPVERHLKHEGQKGRKGQAGGSEPGFKHGGGGIADDGKHKVGITSQKQTTDPKTGEKTQRPEELVFQEMQKLEEELRKIQDVGNINIGEGKGGWRNEKGEIEHEAAWVVEFTGNGEAEKLIAQTAKKYDQAMVIWMDDCQPPSCETMVNYTMDSTVTEEMMGAVSTEMGGLGYKGWTWFQGDGDRYHLRVGDPPKNGTEVLNGFMDDREIGYSAKDSPVKMRYWGKEDIEEHAGDRSEEE